jgi:hypothetical protein
LIDLYALKYKGDNEDDIQIPQQRKKEKHHRSQATRWRGSN